MEEEKLLKKLGLSNYETAVYLKLVELGTSEASTIYRKSNVPFGRIYEELNSLASKGLIEIQNTRPKKYKIKKPKTAFKNLLKNKKEEMEGELQRTVETISQLEDKILKRMPPTQPNEKAFWTVAVGNEEISEMMKYNLDEAEKELCIISRSHTEDREKQPIMKPEIMKSLQNAVKRGVKIKVLIDEDFTIPSGILDEGKLKQLLDKLEVRITGKTTSYYEICDNNKVMFKIDNPAKPGEILAIIRIYDMKLSKELKTKFDELWLTAKTP